MRAVCGLKKASTSSAFSRFLSKLLDMEAEIRVIFGQLVKELIELLPDFGENLGIDGKAIPTHAKVHQESKPDDGRRDNDANSAQMAFFIYPLPSLVIELRQKMKVANLTAIPESFQTGIFDKPGMINNPYLHYACLGLCEYITSHISGSIPFDKEKLKKALSCLEALLASNADLKAIKNNLKDCGIRLFYLPRFNGLKLEGYATMTVDETYALFIFKQGANLAKLNNSLLRCIKSITTGKVVSRRVFNRCNKEK